MVNTMYYKLKKLRSMNKYSCAQMADKLSITSVYYYQIESGKRNLSYNMAVKIAKIFNKLPDEIFYEDHLKKLK